MRIFLCLLLAASTVQAGTALDNEGPAKGLPLDQLQAIRKIGQNVLQAKKDAEQSPDNLTVANSGNLAQLKATVDALIAAESPLVSPASQPIVTNGSGANKPTGKGLVARMASQSQAWDVADTLRQDATQLQSQNNKPAKVEVHSGGFPVGEQHGRLYDQWADKLETILSNNGPDRLAQLKAFQTELTVKNRRDMQSPNTPRTPSIRAMPWIDPNAASANPPSQ